MVEAPRKHIWNASFVLFVALLAMSFVYYTQADEMTSEKNFFQDTDGDGLSNSEEAALGTDPNVADTDGDGYSDAVEVQSGYNPLKPAPGDRIIANDTNDGSVTDGTNANVNYTQKTSAELAAIVKDVASQTDENKQLSAEDIDAALQKALASSSEEIVLPEVDVKDIKIKKVKKGLEGDAKKEQDKKDIVEYLTMLSYIVVNNSPISIQKGNDYQAAADSLSTKAMLALTTGDYTYLDSLEMQGKKFLDEIKDIEVPESMLDTHVKAMQLALYASTLKSELKNTQSDPLGQVSTYGKVQAFMSEMQSFATETFGKLGTYGIQGLPVGL